MLKCKRATASLAGAATVVVVALLNSIILANSARIGGLFPPVVELSSFKTITSTSTCGLNNNAMTYCLSSLLNTSATTCTQRTCLMACCSSCGTVKPISVALENGVQFQIMRITDTRPASSLGQSKSFQTGSKIESDNIPVANIESSGISCTAWVKQLTGNTGAIISKGNSYALVITQYEMYFSYTTKDSAATTRTMTMRNLNAYQSSRWQHVAFVVYGKDFSLFVDGVLQRALILEGYLNDVMGTVTIGQNNGKDQYIGLMQEVKYYSKGLTNREVIEAMTDSLPSVFAYGHCRCPSSHPAISPRNSFYCMKNGIQVSTEVRLILRLDPDAHPVEYTIDGEVVTYWLSEMTNEVTIEIDLKHSDLQVNMVQLQFYSPPSKGIRIDRSLNGGTAYQPWQYFATDCSTQYNLPNNGPLNSADAVNCLQVSSPGYSWETVTFRTHEPGPENMPLRPFDVPNCNDIYCSPKLLDFVKATNVKVQLSGHTLVSHPNHQYFGVRRIIVGGSCDCFGHGSECEFYDANSTHIASYACKCDPRTFTGGPKCETCLALYNHKPFKRGTVFDAYPCVGCPCNGHAESCRYAITLDPNPDDRNETSGGGVCINCQHNTVGRFCQLCKDHFYRASDRLINAVDACQACNCIGPGVALNSFSCQKDDSTPGVMAGQCACKANTEGRQCDRCKTGYYQLTNSNPAGCLACGCSMGGTINSTGTCDAVTGSCACKAKVSGLKCDFCHVNYFGLSASNPEGCSPCSCDPWGSKNTACESFSGQCICKVSTEGRRCNRCKQGYYDLTETGCRTCRCSAAGTDQAQLNSCNGQTGQCVCRLYTTGTLCDRCKPGYYNLDPANLLGCSPCQCDSHGTIGNLGECDLVTGNCSCKALVTGRQCNLCRPGNYNLTMQNPDGCMQCLCNAQGTVGGDASPALPCTNTGQCNCLPNAIGPRCTSCSDQYYWNPTGLGCLQCSCDATGAVSSGCNSTGYCTCRQGNGIGGRRCDQCLPGYYNFVSGTCQSCGCLPAGSNGATCDSLGTCTQCKGNVEGVKCNTCKPGTTNLHSDNPFGCSGPPSQQSPPQVTILSPRSATITWIPPDNANGVITKYELYKNGTMVYSGVGRTHSETTLTPYTSYTFYLLSFTTAGSTMSVDSDRIYRTAPAVPQQLSALTISNVLERSVFASWQPPQLPNGIITSYSVRSTNNRDTDLATHYTGNELSQQIMSLKPFTIYAFSLTVCNTVGCLSGVSVTAATRSSAPDTQPAPYTTPMPGGRRVLVNWDAPSAPNGNILFYDLYVRSAPFNTPGRTAVLKLDPRWRNFTVDSLIPYTEYEFRVISYTAQVSGDTSSNWTRVRTLEDAPSGSEFINPTATAVSSFLVALTWNAPGSANGHVIRFEIYRYEAASQFTQPILSATVAGNLRSHTLDKCEPYTRYEFTVKACNSIGCTGHSFKTSTTTLAAAPSNQPAPSLAPLAYQMVNLSWPEPLQLNGPLPLAFYVERRMASFYYPPPDVEIGRRFPGNGFIQLDAAAIADSADSRLLLRFKTRYANGLLFYAASGGQQDLFAVELRSGKPWLIFDTDSGASAFTVVGSATFSDGNWHKILATRTNLVGRLVVDDQYIGNGLGGGPSVVIGQIASIFIGGLPATYVVTRGDVGNTLLVRRSFVGCLRDVTWKDRLLDINANVIASDGVAGPHEACPSGLTTGLHFLGGGHAQVTQTGFAAGGLFSFEFQFRTQMSSGLILAAFGSAGVYLTVSYDGNLIRVSYRYPGDTNTFKASAVGTMLCDGNWHRLVVLSNSFSQIELTLDGSTTVSSPVPPQVNTSLIYIGGVPQGSAAEMTLVNGGVSTQAFAGCLRDLRFITSMVNFEEQLGAREGVTLDGCPSDMAPFNTIGSCLPVAPLQIADTAQLSFLDTSLLSFTEYQYRVKSYQPGVSGFATSPWIATRTREGVPSGLVDPVVTAVDKRIVNMTWSTPTISGGLVLKYELVAKTTTATDVEISVDVPDVLQRSYNISGLSPYTMYNMCYRVFTAAGMAQSNFITVTTKPDVPEGFDRPIIDARPTSLNITWRPPQKPNGRVIFYQVELDDTRYYNGDGLNTIIDSLNIYTSYNLRLAVCATGGCSWVEMVVFTGQLPPEGVHAPLLEVMGSRRMSVTWQEPIKLNGAIVRYEVLVATLDQVADYTVAANASATTRSTVLDNLIPGTFYYVRMAAYTGGGGTVGNVSTAMTYESAPEQLPPPAAVPISPQSISVTVVDPLFPNGIITRYELYEDGILVLNGTIKNHTGTGFLPFSPHVYRSRACTVKGCATSDDVTAFTLDAPPVGSVSLVAAVIGPRSVSASWTTVAQPNGNMTYSLLATGEFYKVFDGVPVLYEVETRTQALYAGPLSAFAFRSDDLLPFATYFVQVNASNRAAFLLSNTISVITPAAPPDGVNPPQVNSYSDTVLRVTWMPPGRSNGLVTSYNLFGRFPLNDGTGGTVVRHLTNSIVATHVVTDLKPFTTYEFRMAVNNSAGSTSSEWENGTTKEAVPESVDPPKIVSIQSRSVVAELSSPATPNGVIVAFVLFVNGTEINRTLEQNILVRNLQPFTVYVFHIQACTSIGCVRSPDALPFRTLADVPDDMFPPRLTVSGPRTVNVTWDPPVSSNGPVTLYEVQRRRHGSVPFVTIATVDPLVTAGNTYLDATLTPFTTYQFRVVARTQAGGTPGPFASITTSQDGPNSVSQPTVIASSPSSLIVRWEKADETNGPVTHYFVKIPGRSVLVNSSSTFESTLTSLQSYFLYAVVISACSVGGCTDSLPTWERTLESPPGLPSSPVAFVLTSTSLRIRWIEPQNANGPILSYCIERRTLEDLVSSNVNQPSPWTQIAVTSSNVFDDINLGIFSLQQYRVIVKTTQGNATSNSSSPYRTAAETPLSGVFVTGIASNHTTVLLTWAVPPVQLLRGEPQQYTIRYEIVNGAVHVHGSVIDGKQTSAVITGLTPSTNYLFEVTISNGKGSFASNKAAIRTLDGAPEGFVAPDVYAVSSREIRVSWQAPQVPNGVVQNYSIIANGVQLDTVDGTTLFRVQGGLLPYTVYRIKVRVCTVFSCVLTPMAETRTEPDVPTNFQAPTVVALTSSSISVTWDPPVNENGIMLGYYLYRRHEMQCVTQPPPITKCTFVDCSLQEQLCGGICYDPRLKHCCAGVLHNSDPTKRCCGSSFVSINAADDVCCGGQFYPKQDTYKCCFGVYQRVFDGQICCNGNAGVVVSVGNACCGDVPYDVNGTKSCVCSTLYDKVSPPVRQCCGGRVVPFGQQCCGSGPIAQAYDFNANRMCCGVSYIDASNALCCQDAVGTVKVHNFTTSAALTGSKCCGTNAISANQGCCNDRGYDATTQVCSDRTTSIDQSNCGTGTVCDTVHQLRAYCDRCDFDATTRTCGSVNGYYNATLQADARNRTTCVADYVLIIARPDDASFRSYNDAGLESHTVYEYRVVGANTIGNATSASASARTLMSSPEGVAPPVPVVVSDVLIVVTWQPPTKPNGDVMEYRLIRVKWTNKVELLVFSGLALSFADREQLEPNTGYLYILSACTVFCTNQSAAGLVYTQQAAPENVLPPVIIAVSPYSLRVNWSLPGKPNGIITRYNVTILRDGQYIPLLDSNDLGLSMSTVVNGLSPYTFYEFRTEACTIVGCSVGPTAGASTLQAPPDGVTPPRLTILTAKSIEIEWRYPITPNGIVESFFLYRDGIIVFSGNATLFRDTSVVPVTTYEYYFDVLNGGGATRSNSTSATTPESTPEGISPPLVTPVSATALSVTWSAPASPNGVITSYGIIYNELKGDVTTLNSGLNRVLTISNLKPYTVYEVRVSACTVKGCGTGDRANGRTLETTPSGQAAPLAMAKAFDVVELAWSLPAFPNGLITRFEVERRLGINGVPVIIFVGPSMSYIDSQLNAYTVYNYRVRARNSIGIAQSEWTSIRTLEGIPSGFSDLVIATFGSNSVTVQWIPPATPNGVIVGYELMVRLFGNVASESVAVCCLSANARGASVMNLTAATSFEFRLAASTGGGIGFSNWAMAKTLEAPPQGLPMLMVDKNPDGLSDGKSLRVYWTEPNSPNGVITSYALAMDNSTVYQGVARETVVRRLDPYTSYSFQLSACNSAGCTSATPQVLTTAEVAPAGQSPPVVGAVTAYTISMALPLPASPNGVILRIEVIRTIDTTRRRRATETTVFSTTDTNNATLTFTDTDLQPFTTYRYKIRVVNSAGVVDSDWITVTTKQGPPSVVTPPSLTPLAGGNSMLLQWTAPGQTNGDVQYYLVFRNGSLLVSTSGLSHTDTGLQPDTLYGYSISACTAGGCGQSVTSLARTLSSAPGNMPPPLLAPLSSSEIAATWSAPTSPNGIIVKYQLRFASSSQLLFEGFALAFTVRGLASFTDYTFQVSACTVSSCTTSSPATATTLEAVPTGILPPTFIVIGARAVQVSWSGPTQPNGIIRYFSLLREGVLVYNGSDVRYVDRTVQPGTRYGYSITAVNSAGPVTSDLAFITTSPGVPEGFQPPIAQALSSTQMQLSWTQPTQPNGVITNYHVQYVRRNDGVANELSVGLSLSYIVVSLSAYTMYDFRIKACTTVGCTSSLSTGARTLEAPPINQTAPYYDTAFVFSRSILIQWLPPRLPNGVITHYALYRRPSVSHAAVKVFEGAGLAFTDATAGVILPNTAYEYSIVSFNSVGSTSSGWSVVTTKPAPPEDVQSITVTGSDIQATEFDFTVMEPLSPNGVIINYIVHVLGVRNITLGKVVRGTVTGLLPYTSYSVEVTACNVVGCATGASVVVTTGIAAPTGLDTSPRIQQVTSTSVFVEWDAPSRPNGPISKYELVRVLTCPQAAIPDLLCREETVVLDNGLAMMLNATGLRPYSTYSFRVQVHNPMGSQSSPTVSQTTLAQPPVVVAVPQLTVIGNTVTVNWTKTFDLRSQLVEFTLEENNVLAYTGNKYIVARPGREVGEYSYIVRAFTKVNGIDAQVNAALVKITVGPGAPPTAAGRTADDVWYKEMWFLVLIAVIGISILFVCIVLLLRCCNNRRTVYIRERVPLPTRPKGRLESRGPSPMTWDGVSEKAYPHLHPSSRVGRTGKLPLDLLSVTPNHYSSSRDLLASTDRLPNSRLDDRYSYGDEDDVTWDGYIKALSGGSRMADRDSGLYDDDKLSPVSNEDDDDDVQGYHSIQQERILFPDTHL